MAQSQLLSSKTVTGQEAHKEGNKVQSPSKQQASDEVSMVLGNVLTILREASPFLLKQEKVLLLVQKRISCQAM